MKFKNRIQTNRFQLFSLLGVIVVLSVLFTSCDPDETQVVTNFTTITSSGTNTITSPGTNTITSLRYAQ